MTPPPRTLLVPRRYGSLSTSGHVLDTRYADLQTNWLPTEPLTAVRPAGLVTVW